MSKMRRCLGLALLALLACVTGIRSHAQAKPGITIRVTESAGIRRTEYPVRARVSLPRGAVTDATHARLHADDQARTDVPAQYSIATQWPDGSAQALDVDFNVSLGPADVRTYQLEYGADITAAAPPRGLAVVEDADTIQMGNVRFSRSGSPLMASATYVRTEFIGQGRNGFAIIDTTGARHETPAAQPLKVEVMKRGPILAALQYSGTVAIDASYAVPFTLAIEMPNSKSWIKWSIDVTDPARRVRDLDIDTPFAFGAFPWLWDFGTDNGTYGVFRNATDTVMFTQVVGAAPPSANHWLVETGAQGAALRPLETSAKMASGWGHLQGTGTAVAFAIDDIASTPGTYVVALNGSGQATFRFSPAGTATAHHFGLYEHFVSTPIPIGAATTPTSMLHPPAVVVSGN